jgi:hypothetical protein
MPTRIELIADCGNGYGWSVVRFPNGMLEIAILKGDTIPKDIPFIAGGAYKCASIMCAANVMKQIAAL